MTDAPVLVSTHVEATLGTGTATGIAGLLVGASLGQRFTVSAGAGFSRDGLQTGAHADAYPLVGRRWSLGLRTTFSMGRFTQRNCDPSCSVATTPDRDTIRYDRAYWIGVAVVGRFRASSTISADVHLGGEGIVNHDDWHCIEDNRGLDCAHRNTSFANMWIADLGLTVRWAFASF